MKITPENYNALLPYINTLIGGFMTLIGFKIYKPFTKEKEELFYKKYGLLFKLGGAVMFVWGVANIILSI